MPQLQYVPFISAIEHSFWSELNAKKLDELKLDDRELPIVANYVNDSQAGVPAHVSFNYDSFNVAVHQPRRYTYHGHILNTNTIEEFKGKDFNQVLKTAGTKVWDAIRTGSAITQPGLLNYFYVVTFADLKKYRYSYWFCFPAFTPTVTLISSSLISDSEFTEDEIAKIKENTQDKGVCFLDKDLSTITEPKKYFDSEVYLVMADPSTADDHPGWPLRNLLSLISYHVEDPTTVNVICKREVKLAGQESMNNSLVLKCCVQPMASRDEMPKVVGWERNNKGKLSSKFVDLSASMDPAKISESSVNLNLKLMRWRLLPELDLSVIQNVNALVLGSGTLGCNVARCLLGWGVKKITMLDNGKVSYSNPVRQSLFDFSDCGKPKALTAAKKIAMINPGAEAKGVNLSIPMPGHPVVNLELERVKADIDTLEQLVDAADVVFLLTDTRESRWLPTLMCSAKHKICINSALGFDTYLVMRHGVRDDGDDLAPPEIGAKVIQGSQLGCYFCNDVVAPSDSTKDRTLDQMCTVTRPGNAYLAGALAVELMVSLLQHPMKGRAPAMMDISNNSGDSCLGRVPHQIRGFLAQFTSVQPSCHAFNKCTACCKEVIEKYRDSKYDFLIDVFNTPDYLEKISGLYDMIENTDLDDIWEFNSDSD